jgi:hypothetical protein
LLFVGRTRRITQYTASGMRLIKTNSSLPTRCSRRFRFGKNSYQLFLPCYPTTPSAVKTWTCGLYRQWVTAISSFFVIPSVRLPLNASWWSARCAISFLVFASLLLKSVFCIRCRRIVLQELIS